MLSIAWACFRNVLSVFIKKQLNCNEKFKRKARSIFGHKPLVLFSIRRDLSIPEL